MKKKINMFLIILLFTNFCFCQTKEETVDWISQEIKSHSGYNKNYSEFSNYFIRENNTVIIRQDFEVDNGEIKSISESIIPIKSITSIKVSQYQNSDTTNQYNNSIVFELNCKFKCVKNSSFNDDGKTKEEFTSNEFFLRIDNQDMTLKNRVPKALLHIIKLCGGNAKLESVKKDIF